MIPETDVERLVLRAATLGRYLPTSSVEEIWANVNHKTSLMKEGLACLEFASQPTFLVENVGQKAAQEEKPGGDGPFRHKAPPLLTAVCKSMTSS